MAGYLCHIICDEGETICVLFVVVVIVQHNMKDTEFSGFLCLIVYSGA